MTAPRNGLAMGLLAACLLAAADPQWMRTQSAHFTLYSSAGSGLTRDTLKHFEFVHAFFEQALGKAPGERPVYLVLFGSDKEYARRRSADWSAAEFHQLPGSDVIVMGSANDELGMAVHEYFHLWASR